MDSTEQSPFWEANSSSASKEISSNEMWRCITMFTLAWYLSYPEQDESNSHHPILNFRAYFNANIPSMHMSSTGCLSFRFSHPNPVCISLVLHLCHMPSPCSLIQTPKKHWHTKYISWSCSLHNFLHPLPFLFSILDPSIFLSNLVSNVFSQRDIPSFTPISISI